MSEVVWQDVAERLALSPQQKRIVELILQQQTDKAIASELGLTVPTVKTYTRRIYTKTRTDGRLSLVMLIWHVSRVSAEAR